MRAIVFLPFSSLLKKTPIQTITGIADARVAMVMRRMGGMFLARKLGD